MKSTHRVHGTSTEGADRAPSSSSNHYHSTLRCIRKGLVWLLTKKTNDDRYILRPDGTIDLAFLYLLILKLNKYGLLLHAFVVMSNHIHLVVTDVHGKLPKFMCEFLSESGKALKLALDTTCRVWSGDRYSAVEILDRDAAERAIEYCQTNPTRAGLTLPKDWPGLSSAHYEIGDTLRAERPEFYGSKKRPDVVECVLSPLPRMIGESEDEVLDREALSRSKPGSDGEAKIVERQCSRLQRAVEGRVEKRVAEILEKRAKEGRGPLAGRGAVRQVPREKRGNHPFRRIRPKFMTKDHELMEQAKEGYKAFCVAHYDAKERYVAGETKTWFPHGTYGYRELLGVNVRSGGAAA